MSEDNVETYQDAFPSLPNSRQRPAVSQPSGPFLRRSGNSAAAAFSERIVIPKEEQKTRDAKGFRSGKSEMENQMKRIKTDNPKVTITHSVNPYGTLTVLVKGRKEDVAKAKKTVVSRLQTQAFIELDIPREHYGSIIGPKGAVLNELSSKYAVRINIPKDGDDNKLIKILGSSADCRRAAEEIKRISLERAKKDSKQLSIAKAYHALVAGPGNETIRRLEQQHGIKIHVPPQSTDSDNIAVTGDRDAVAAASCELLKIYNDLLESCGELTAQIPHTQHRFVIGQKGINLRQIAKETGVIVEVPPADKQDDTIILRGDRSKLAAALALVYEFSNKVVMKKLDVPRWIHRHLIGEKGSNIGKLRKDYPKVFVKFPNEEKETEIVLEGPPEDVEAVRESLRTLADELTTTLRHQTIKVPSKFHQHIIGQNGSRIRQFRQSTGAYIDAPKETDIINLEGTPEAVAKAKDEILAFVKKIENQKTATVSIPSAVHAQVIGPKGETIRTIRDANPSVNIQFPDKGSDSDEILLRGDKTEVDSAVKALNELGAKLVAENYSENVHIFRVFHLNVIGKNGETINKIRNATNVRIQVPAVEEESDEITITGLKANVQKAKKMLLDVQNEAGNIVTKNLDIDAKYHPTIRGNGDKVLESLQADLSVIITVPQAKAKSSTITVYGPSASVEAAVATIGKLATDEALSSTVVEIECPGKYIRNIKGKDRQASDKVVAETGLIYLAFPPRRSKSSTILAIGSKQACQAAKKVIEERVAELVRTVTKDVEIAAEYYPKLRSNQFLRGIESENMVRVNLPRDEGNTKVVVKGPSDGVDAAIKALQDKVAFFENSISREFPVDAADIPAILGQGGSNIRAVCSENNVSVDIPKKSQASEDGKVAITVEGLEDGVAAALAALEKLIPVSESVNAPVAVHRFLVLDKEVGVKHMRDQYNVSVDIPNKDSGSEAITIRGQPEAVAECKAFLEGVLKKNFVLTIQIPQAHHRDVIGNRGAKVNELRKKHDVKIDLTRNSDDITLIGEEANCNACAAEIKEMVAILESFVTKEAEIHASVHGKIIGPRGAVIKEIQEKYDVKVNMPRDRDTHIISVTGPEAAVDDCIEELYIIQDDNEDLIEEAEEMSRYVKPTQSTATPKKNANEQFKVANAPWQGSSDNASFPTLGNKTHAPLMGAWARK